MMRRYDLPAVEGVFIGSSARTRSAVVVWAAAAVLLGLLAALPRLSGPYGLGLATEVLIFAVLAMSLDLLLGYAGLTSLGHAAYFGVGGYTVGLLARHLGITSIAALPLAVLAGAAVAALFGLLVLRVGGAYFLMLTLALGQLLYGLVWMWRPITGGDDGLAGIPRPSLPGGSGLLWDDRAFYYLTLLCALAACADMAWLARSRFGLALRGIRDSESRMASLGYDVRRYRYAAFVVAGAIAALAGALYAWFFGYVSPHHLSWALSGEVLVMVILGGAGTLWGPALGALAVNLLRYEVSSYTERWLTVLGLTFIAAVLFAPQGIAGLARGRPWRRARGAAPVIPASSGGRGAHGWRRFE